LTRFRSAAGAGVALAAKGKTTDCINSIGATINWRRSYFLWGEAGLQRVPNSAADTDIALEASVRILFVFISD